MNNPGASSVGEQLVSTAGKALDAGLFWRGNLAKAVQRKDYKGTFWGILGLSIVLFFYVWQHMQVVKLGYEVQALKAEKQQFTNDYYYLKYRMNEVNSLTRVEKIARDQMGMITPKSDQVVILNEGSPLTPRWFTLWAEAMKKTDKH
jgi:cell division protein FtsL